MNVYLIRHGKTQFIEQNMHQYSSTPLSEKGREEVQAMQSHVQEIRTDAFYVSPMKRALETAQILQPVIKVPMTIYDDLHELQRPSILEGKKRDDELAMSIKEEMKKHVNEKEWHYSDEENFWDVEKRTRKVMAFLLTKNHENVLLVTHGLFIRMFVALSLFDIHLTPGIFQKFYDRVHITNTGLTECNYTKETGWSLLRLNDTRHLSES